MKLSFVCFEISRERSKKSAVRTHFHFDFRNMETRKKTHFLWLQNKTFKKIDHSKYHRKAYQDRKSRSHERVRHGARERAMVLHSSTKAIMAQEKSRICRLCTQFAK